VATAERRFGAVHRAAALRLAGDGRHIHDVAVVADAYLGLEVPVDAFDRLQKPVHKMRAELLTIRHSGDAGVLLLLDPDERGVALGLIQR
jgi:hypothetical protein